MDQDGLTVATTAGPVTGCVRDGAKAWLGIPYAAAPVGQFRFRAPQPVPPWSDPRDASNYGAIAPQVPLKFLGITPATPQSEDCLFLNVWAPITNTAPLPVMVWIHGGAYAFGSSSQPAYNGSKWVNTGDVILVTINYRLGALGYLDLSSFATDGDMVNQNNALRDQIAALEWVRENIASFGGDPNNITLFGQSAGAGAVTTLMATPSARGLFHRAISQSSPATSVYGAARMNRITQRFLELVGLDRAGKSLVGTLRAMPVGQLLKFSQLLYDDSPLTSPGTLAYAPVVDGSLVPDYPIRVFERGEQNPVPMILGNVRDEATLFRYMKSPLVPVQTDVLRALFGEVQRDHPAVALPSEPQLLSAYRGKRNMNARLHIAGDFGFRMPALWFARAHSRIAPTWLYRFDFCTPMMRLARIGATHATEVPLQFGRIVTRGTPTYKLGGASAAAAVGTSVRDAFTAFARDGAPGTNWPQYTQQSQATWLFDRSSRLQPRLDEKLWHAWGSEPLYLN